jgi:hypothetical protein
MQTNQKIENQSIPVIEVKSTRNFVDEAPTVLTGDMFVNDPFLYGVKTSGFVHENFSNKKRCDYGPITRNVMPVKFSFPDPLTQRGVQRLKPLHNFKCKSCGRSELGMRGTCEISRKRCIELSTCYACSSH